MPSKEFPDDLTSVRAAREFVVATLQPYGIHAVMARLITSELATNVVRHAQTPFRVSVSVESDAIRIEVEDGAGALMIAREMATDSGGFGLRLVEAVATTWGVENRGAKKAVWVRLPKLADMPDQSSQMDPPTRGPGD